MNRFLNKTLSVSIICGVMAVASGCVGTAPSLDGNTAAVQVGEEAIVYGKFRLVRNGEAVRLDNDLFSGTATLHLQNVREGREFDGQVGKDGEFAWQMAPGVYRLTSISFGFHGETLRPDANFTFVVSDEHEASYVGTVTLEAQVDSGYYGVSGAVDRYTVRNDCAVHCGQRLARLGLDAESNAISLMQWQQQVARSN